MHLVLGPEFVWTPLGEYDCVRVLLPLHAVSTFLSSGTAHFSGICWKTGQINAQILIL